MDSGQISRPLDIPEFMIDDSLTNYIETSILPLYDGFDAAHQRGHVDMVIEQSMAIAADLDVDMNMVYAIAAYHDTGLTADRKTHHLVSGRIVREDMWLRKWFSEEQIEIMAQACEDHRASSDHEPRSIYGKIVAEADRFIDPDTIIKRTVQYGLANYPELDKEGHWQRTVDHLNEKYAEGGYLRLWFENSPNVARLNALRKIIKDERLLREKFDHLHDTLTNHQHIDSKEDNPTAQFPPKNSNLMELKEMSLEELWELFPIALSPHNPEWKRWADDEIQSLSALLTYYTPTINHIGSTAVPGIMAKPIVDILVEISSSCDWREVKNILEASGYICMCASVKRMSFNKGYTPAGYADRVFHIHIHDIGDNDEICFRDFLKRNPSVAKEYESLKLSLLPKYTNNRDGYTEAKTDFINKVITSAKRNDTD